MSSLYLTHPLGPIPQGLVLNVLSGSSGVWLDSGRGSGSRGWPDVGSCPDVGSESGIRGWPDVGSCLAEQTILCVSVADPVGLTDI